jgi:hypothetical protein
MNRLPVTPPVKRCATVVTSRGETHVILFDSASAAEAQRVAGRWAINPEYAFNWSDAAKLSAQIRDDTACTNG